MCRGTFCRVDDVLNLLGSGYTIAHGGGNAHANPNERKDVGERVWEEEHAGPVRKMIIASIDHQGSWCAGQCKNI